MAVRLLLIGLIGIALVALAPFAGAQLTIPPDADAPEPIRRLLPEAKRSLAGHLDLMVTDVRYVGAELRDEDHLVILYFELRQYPFFGSELAYLVSRCTPLEELDPSGMGGGRGITDAATDPELVHLRSDEQPACQLHR